LGARLTAAAVAAVMAAPKVCPISPRTTDPVRYASTGVKLATGTAWSPVVAVVTSAVVVTCCVWATKLPDTTGAARVRTVPVGMVTAPAGVAARVMLVVAAPAVRAAARVRPVVGRTVHETPAVTADTHAPAGTPAARNR
jgi:hypothetical protein